MSKFFKDTIQGLLEAVKIKHKITNPKGSSWDELEKEIFTQEEIDESNKCIKEMLLK